MPAYQLAFLCRLFLASYGASTSATHNALHTDARLCTEADLQVPFCHPLAFGLVEQRSERVDPKHALDTPKSNHLIAYLTKYHPIHWQYQA